MPEPKPGQWDIDLDEIPALKERATVALVSEQVKGVERLVEAGFKDTQRQLDSLSGLPDRMTHLEGRVDVLEKDKEAHEQRRIDKRVWRRGIFTAAGLAVFGTLVNLGIANHVFSHIF